MRVPTAPFDGGYDVHGTQTGRAGSESERATVPVFHQTAEGIRLFQPHTYLAGACSLWSPSTDDGSNPHIPRWDESLRAE